MVSVIEYVREEPVVSLIQQCWMRLSNNGQNNVAGVKLSYVHTALASSQT